jgi:hypothetical protein
MCAAHAEAFGRLVRRQRGGWLERGDHQLTRQFNLAWG